MGLEFHYYVPGCFQDPRSDVELGKYAAERGFEGIWIGDHFLPWLDNRPYTHQILPWLGAFMNEVPDVTVGTFVTCPTVRYEPPVLAQALATLDNMYPGRFELGVGTGEALNEAQFLDGEWPEWDALAEMLVESLDVVDTLWEADEYVDYDGDHYSYDAMQLYTQPRSELPTHWAAWGPQSAEMAGEHAGNLMTASPPEHIERLVPRFEAGLDAAGRDPEDAHVATQLNAHVGDPDELVAEIRERGEHTPHDTELDNPDPRDVQAAADAELAEMSDAEIREENNIVSDPDELVDQIAALEDAGVTRVILVSKVGDYRETIDVVADEVMPAFE
ncbi:LLM class flavin-dependent oxidoreductase [Halosimplex marinum]|uniref:LLM class flavin-dependent oxidoreductase n=1 Tax=Halosimplex marinum TaxID=3396620 RepID=UPI003F56FCDE